MQGTERMVIVASGVTVPEFTPHARRIALRAIKREAIARQSKPTGGTPAHLAVRLPVSPPSLRVVDAHSFTGKVLVSRILGLAVESDEEFTKFVGRGLPVPDELFKVEPHQGQVILTECSRRTVDSPESAFPPQWHIGKG